MYESWFQFEKRPFGAAPQVNDYFPARSIEAACHAIGRGLEANAGPGLVIGGTGMGKTTLCLKLQQQYRETLPVAYVSCCGIQSRRELLQNILLTFELPYAGNDDGELRIALTNFAREAADHTVLLILDDVDDLAPEALEELRWLSNITHDGSWCVQLVLAGKSSLEERLGAPGMESFDQRISSRNYLSRATAPETAEFIQFQIARCGGDASQIFSDAALAEIHTATDGVPRLVNQLGDQALIMATLAKVECLEQLHIEEAWADLQQLPAPKRASAATPAADDAEIEFGTLDQDDDHPALPAESPEPDGADGLETSLESNAVVEQQPEEHGNALIEFGELAANDGTDSTPDNESNQPASPTFDFVDMDGSEWHGSGGEVADTDAMSDNLESHATADQGDLVDRLDDIEREVHRVSVELDGDAKQRASAQPPASPGNPFLEIFDEDELVFSAHTTLHNEIVGRHPPVFTGGGESLINVMRMVDQRGPAETPWERLDDTSKPAPPDPRLALEVAPLPIRELPKITQANTDSVQFSEGEFRFNYAAPIPQAPPAGNDVSGSPSLPPNADLGNNITGSTNQPETVVICSSSGQQVVHIPQTGLLSVTQPTVATEPATGAPESPQASPPQVDEIIAVVDDSPPPIIDSYAAPPGMDEWAHDQGPTVADSEAAATDSDLSFAGQSSEEETEASAIAGPTDPAATAQPESLSPGNTETASDPATVEPPTATQRPRRRRFNKLFSDLNSADSDSD